LRPARYVTQKIVRGAVEIAAGRAGAIELGMLNIARDWGWAPEYVDAMARMLDLETPEDFVIATGQTRTLEDFVAAAFASVGRDWRDHVVDNPALHRPIDIFYSSGNPSKAARLLDWKAEKKMIDVVGLLVDAEMQRRTMKDR
jgi:GDPmannose 4,6-dehydratase